MSAAPIARGVRGIVFDLDGTLIDSYDAIGESLNYALRALGRKSLEPARIRKLVGRGLESLIERATDSSDPQVIEAAVRLFRERYDTVCIESTRLLPDVKETLSTLEGMGLALAVATNKPSYFARRILDALSIGSHLRAVLGPDLVPRPKPHPDMMAAVLSRLGIRPSEAVYVGDMDVDVETARAAGVRVILLPTGSCTMDELRGAGADLVLSRFGALSELFGENA